MRTSESVTVPASPADVFPHVARLERYPDWLRLVHAADVVAEQPVPAWNVELRARVGPFARSKRLRMEQVELEHDRTVAFERRELDGRQHARWALRVELMPSEGGDEGCTITMHLAYDGSLWSAPVLGRVLDDEVRRGREGLTRLVSSATPPTH